MSGKDQTITTVDQELLKSIYTTFYQKECVNTLTHRILNDTTNCSDGKKLPNTEISTILHSYTSKGKITEPEEGKRVMTIKLLKYRCVCFYQYAKNKDYF